MAEVIHPERLIFLAELRKGKDANYTHRDMARHFGLHRKYSYQTVGQWERGQIIPPAEYRALFIEYLWHVLGLRRRPSDFEEKWQVLVEEWQWAPLDSEERRKLKLAPIEETNPPADTLVPADVVPMQVPAYAVHFVGRSKEMAASTELLTVALPKRASSPATPIILALVGMGGIGKTTLATRIAHQLRGEFRDGILWGRVATDNVLDILQSWAQAYDYDFSTIASVESRAAAVRNLMQGKQALIILDDVTTLTKGAQLLPATADCAVLLTTRNLDIANALHAQPVLLGELNEAESVKLLIATIGNARVQAELDAATAICKTLQCLPLAVELVAQRLASRPRQSLTATVALLQDAGYRLDLGISDRAVRTSFLVSWNALTVKQQRLFALMGVFGGRRFAAEALAYVADAERVVTEAALMDLAALSLVKEEGAYYRQHPLLADFAQEQLGEEITPYQRMARYFLEFAQVNRTQYAILDPEWDSMMVGMETAHRLQQWQLVLDYAESLTEPWLTRAEYTRARQGYALAVEAAQQLQAEEAEARLLCYWGSVCVEQGDHDEARDLLYRSLQSGYHLEIDEIIADTEFKLARIQLEVADYEAAEKLLANCKAIRTELNDTVGIAAVAYWQGLIAFRSGTNELARNLCLDASYVQKHEHDELGLLRTYRLLTDIFARQGDLENALHYGQQALALAEALQDRGEYAAALYNLSKIYRRKEAWEQAEKSAEDSLVLFRRMGSKLFYAFTLFELSKIKQSHGELATAIQYVEHSVSELRLLRDKFSLVIVLRFLGDLKQQTGDVDSANLIWQDALAIASEQGHPDIDELKGRLRTNSLSMRVTD